MSEWRYDVENDPIVIGAYKDLELKKKHPILAAIIFDGDDTDNPDQYIINAKLRAQKHHEKRNKRTTKILIIISSTIAVLFSLVFFYWLFFIF